MFSSSFIAGSGFVVVLGDDASVVVVPSIIVFGLKVSKLFM